MKSIEKKKSDWKSKNITYIYLNQEIKQNLNTQIMAKSQDAKKTAKKEPLKTAKEKKEEKRDKKNAPKRD